MRVRIFHRMKLRKLSTQSTKFIFWKLKHFNNGILYIYNYGNVVCISRLLLTYSIQNHIPFSLKMKLKWIYFQNCLNEIPMKYSWFNNLHFLMEDGSRVLLARQDEYSIAIISWLFFTALCKDIYFFPQVPSSPKTDKNKIKNKKKESV